MPFDPNRRVLQQYSCFWASLYIWFNPYWSVTISGKEHVDPKKSYVMVSNHASMADILVIFASFLHFKWVSKKEMFKAPFLGWNMWLNGYVGIDRGNPNSREQCMKDCRVWLKKGSPVFFFPEGTRSKDGKLKEFKQGAFRLAAETGVDILPMVISGSSQAIPKHSILLNRKSKMHLQILPPVPVSQASFEEVEEKSSELAVHVREHIAAHLTS